MRITKEPEVRRQEILDAALQIFGEKGYEKTSIADIAKAIGVAQGLCYRYFPSKEALFDSVIEQYASLLAEPFAQYEKETDKPLRQIIEEMPATIEDRDSRYYACFTGLKMRSSTFCSPSNCAKNWSLWRSASCKGPVTGGKCRSATRIRPRCSACMASWALCRTTA